MKYLGPHRRGRCGARYYDFTPQGDFASRLPRPRNPRTPEQTKHRAAFAHLMRLWRTLTEEERKTWER